MLFSVEIKKKSKRKIVWVLSLDLRWSFPWRIHDIHINMWYLKWILLTIPCETFRLLPITWGGFTSELYWYRLIAIDRLKGRLIVNSFTLKYSLYRKFWLTGISNRISYRKAGWSAKLAENGTLVSDIELSTTCPAISVVRSSKFVRSISITLKWTGTRLTKTSLLSS